MASSSESGTTYDLWAEAAERRGRCGRLVEVRGSVDEDEGDG